MKNFKTIINIFLALIFASGFFGLDFKKVSASTTDGTIDSVYKYAWGENIGWINFGAANGNVHITDSGITGYALGETVGWISLDNIVNDGEGNLSGYGWSENTGWIKFDPANGGVIINSSGEFTGSALSETVGWIIFSGDYKVKTDWRPQGARPCTSWTYSDWSSCSGSQQTRTVISSSPSGCVGGSPVLNQICSSGGGGLPPEAYNPPVRPPASSANPEANFKISINDGADFTDSFTVTLSFVAGQDTARMSVSESSDFINGIQIPYQKELKWELLPVPNGQIPKQGIERTIYVKFYTQYGVSSQVYSDSIIIITSLPVVPVPSASPKISPQPSPEVAADKPTFVPQVSLPPEDILIPEISPIPTPVPYFETPPEKPEPINSEWNLIKLPEVKIFSPKPNEISFFTGKFPSLRETFKDLNIFRISDMASRASEAGFSIPGLLEIFALEPANSSGSVSPFTPTPLANLSIDLKKQIPSEIVFVSTASEKINFDSFLVLDEGSLKQKISVPSSTNLNIAIKSDQPAKTISGYITLKKSAYSANTNQESGSMNQESLLRQGYGEQARIMNQSVFSMIYDSYFMIQKAIISFFALSAYAQEQTKSKEIEQRFVLAQFQYTDPDKDGIWIADIQAPAVIGEYEIISLINYQDPSIPSREIRLIAVIDPEGYVFRKEADGQETRLSGVTVSIYSLSVETNQYELWNAKDFDQKNSQTTDATGKYSFLVPAGSYYLKAEARGYRSYQSDIFAVSEANNVHLNLELVSDWSPIKEWKTILLILFGIALAYNFYKDRRRGLMLIKSQSINIK